tara:strand:+ start:91 stop:501 length:411 start_codon:yes stop_codon:yes gene_type:complete
MKNHLTDKLYWQPWTGWSQYAQNHNNTHAVKIDRVAYLFIDAVLANNLPKGHLGYNIESGSISETRQEIMDWLDSVCCDKNLITDLTASCSYSIPEHDYTYGEAVEINFYRVPNCIFSKMGVVSLADYGPQQYVLG